MKKDQGKKYLENSGYFNLKEIPGRGLCGMAYFFFTVAILYGLDEDGYMGRYCYHNEEEAQAAFDKWDGKDDPDGNWIKHKGVREYRNPHFKTTI